MTSDTADTATPSGASACEIDMRVIGFAAPKLLISFGWLVLFPVSLFLIFSKKREIQITMEDVATGQEDVGLQI